MPKHDTAGLILLRADLRKYASKEKAKILARFFKTGPGEYGEGDVFIGVVVPDTRRVAKAYINISLPEAEELLHSKIHEERLCAVLILIEKFRKGDQKTREQIYKFYLENTGYINNWDLIDLSAQHIVGEFLADKPKAVLYELARSKSLWERRIAVLSTFNYICRAKHEETLKIAEILLNDEQDLIQKAVGWMLREVGKRCSEKILEDFLQSRYKKMPRTMLRYAIERLPEARRKAYLKGLV
jgi:3-methyladenine DNA glycosylase AlkD